jgi:hypothetical protein
MKQEIFSRKEVIAIIEDLLERPDLLTDATHNENTNYGAEDLLEVVEAGVAYSQEKSKLKT